MSKPNVAKSLHKIKHALQEKLEDLKRAANQRQQSLLLAQEPASNDGIGKISWGNYSSALLEEATNNKKDSIHAIEECVKALNRRCEREKKRANRQRTESTK
jgi:hypothetical protein